MTEPTVRATRYTFNAHPDPESRNLSRYNVHVERRPNGLWSITHLGEYLTRDGPWSPADDPADWLPQRDAMSAARRVAPLVDVNGHTAAECWAWEQSRRVKP